LVAVGVEALAADAAGGVIYIRDRMAERVGRRDQLARGVVVERGGEARCANAAAGRRYARTWYAFLSSGGRRGGSAMDPSGAVRGAAAAGRVAL
jgi:hypothetical protein